MEVSRKEVDIERLADEDGRYAGEALRFIGEALRHAASQHGSDGKGGPRGHLSARQLIDGAIDLAANRWSGLGGLVLRSWGLCRSEDLGAVTFLLIEAGVFSKEHDDRPEDFANGGELDALVLARLRSRAVEVRP